MIKVIIFDFDGVLVESVDIKTNAFAGLFESYGKRVVKKVVEYHLRHTGVSRFEKFKYIYKNILNEDLTDDISSELCGKYSKLVFGEVITAPFVNGALEFLKSNAGIYRCFISSATPQTEIEKIVRERKMAHYFSNIYGAPKKKDEIVKDIIRITAVTPSQAAYVGDALSDLKAAEANGVNFIARIKEDDTEFCDVDCVKVRDLTTLERILETMNNGA